MTRVTDTVKTAVEAESERPPDRGLQLRERWNSTRHVSRRFEAVLAILVLMVFAFSVAESRFLTSENIQNLLSTAALLWIVSMGMTFVVLTAGIDLSVGSVLALTGIILAQLLNAGVPTVVAIIASLVAGAAIGGGLNGFLIGGLGLSFFVVTLGSMEALQGAVNLWTNLGTIYVNSTLINDIGLGHILGIPVPICFMIVVAAVAFVALRFTYFGRDVYAVGGNLRASRLSGLATKRTLIAVYAVSGLCAAIAALVEVGRLGAASPNVGTNLALEAAAAVLLGGTSFVGGVGGVAGTAIGVLFLATLQNGLEIAGVSIYWQDVATAVVLVAAVLVDRARDANWSPRRVTLPWQRRRVLMGATDHGRGPSGRRGRLWGTRVSAVAPAGSAASGIEVGLASAGPAHGAMDPVHINKSPVARIRGPDPGQLLRNLTPSALIGRIDRESLSRYGAVLVVLVGLFIYLSFTQTQFLTSANIDNLLTGVAVLWVVSLGMTFVVLTAGVDLSVGAILALTGISLAKLLNLGVPSGVAIIMCIAAGTLVGAAINGALIGLVGLSFFVVTLASMVGLGGLASLWAGAASFPIHSNFVINIGSGHLAGVPVAVWIMVAGFLFALFVQRSTYFGRAVYAAGGNRAAARLAGIRVSWTVVLVYAISAGCAAIAGVIEAGRIGDGSPQVGTDIALNAAAAVLLGGTRFTGGFGGVGGTVVGVLFIGTLQNGLSLAGVSSFWQQVVTGVILIAAVLIDRLRPDPTRT